MAISSALNIALSGLRANQRQLDSTANNVANASTIGYSRKIVTTSQQVAGEHINGVRADVMTRQINLQVQRQWRIAVAGAEYASVRATTFSRLDDAFGGPGNPNSLDALFNTFTQTLETLAASPDNPTTRVEAVNSAEQLALGIRQLSTDIQTLRQEAEEGLGSAVTEVNELLRRIADIDKQIVSTKTGGASVAGLEDERDLAVDRLSELMDIRVLDQQNGAISISTTSGTLLYDDQPVQLGFDVHGTIGPNAHWSDDPAERRVGTLVIQSGPGKGIDLFADGAIRSGHIAALKDLRDVTLVEAQAQVDELAARLSEALSTTPVAGTETAGPADGFAIDLTGIREGNVVRMTSVAGGVEQSFSIVATNGTFTGTDRYTADPGDTVIPIDFTQADGDIEAAIQAALGADYAVTYAGGQLTVEDATGGTVDITAMDARITAGGVEGQPALAVFLDAATGEPFTGLTAGEDPRVGLASRLILNPALKLDPGLMVRYDAAIEIGDDVRPRALLDSIAATRFTFDPGVGIGSRTVPFSGTIEQFVRQVVATQGANSSAAVSLAEGQSIVAANLELRYEESRSVNIDEEMARLVELQTAYSANARVLTVAQEMLDALLSI